MSGDTEIRPVTSRRDLLAFVRFPWKVYRGDRNWVPPLISERLARLDPQVNPFFSRGEAELFVAHCGRRLVGTIAAFVDHRANELFGEQVGGFGFFETIEEYSVAQRLLDTAQERVRAWGMSGIRGPTNLTRLDEPGVLIDGADCPPTMLQAHTPSYYRTFLDRYGMTKYHDSYAWRVYLPKLGANLEALPPQLVRVFAAAKERQDVNIRTLRLDDWDNELRLALDLFNTTLSHLRVHVPVTEADFRRFADPLRSFLDPNMALFAEVDGKTVGFLVAVPDVNRVLWRMNGRLLPLGWLAFLWYRRRIDVVSFKLLGVLEEYRRRGIDVLMYLQAIRAAVDGGYRWLDGSHTSEYNPTVVRLAERLGAERYKHFRVYQLMF